MNDTAGNRSVRSFLERVRDPDRQFPHYLFTVGFVLPLSFLTCGAGLYVIFMTAEALLGSGSWVTRGLEILIGPILIALAPIILISFGVPFLLRLYVY